MDDQFVLIKHQAGYVPVREISCLFCIIAIDMCTICSLLNSQSDSRKIMTKDHTNAIILNESIGFRADKKSSSEKHVNCSECDSFSLYPVASGMPYGN